MDRLRRRTIGSRTAQVKTAHSRVVTHWECRPARDTRPVSIMKCGWPIILGMVMFLAVGCSREPKQLTVFVAGDTHGWITPCGCAANQSGGLARRATLVHQSRLDGECLLLDAGGSAMGTSPYQRLRFEYLLGGLKSMGLAVHNIGKSETEFSPADLQAIGQSQGIQWLSANLMNEQGNPVGSPVYQMKFQGRSVLVTGVIDEDQVDNPQWQVSEPVHAILKAFDKQTADIRIVLAYMEEGRLRALAEALPEADFIIGGPTGQAMSPIQVGNTTVMSATNKGKFLAQLKLSPADKGLAKKSTIIAEVSSRLSENPTQIDNLKAYYKRLSEIDYSAAEAGLVSPLANPEPGYAVAGSQACATCHAPDDSVWHSSKHSHAWEVLVTKTAQYDPSCQQCHTTGYGLPAGFDKVANSQALVHVGCENCHGPSQAHVSNPRKRTPFQAKEQCARCHDHENSPAFQYETYWPKVQHQGNKASTP